MALAAKLPAAEKIRSATPGAAACNRQNRVLMGSLDAHYLRMFPRNMEGGLGEAARQGVFPHQLGGRDIQRNLVVVRTKPGQPRMDLIDTNGEPPIRGGLLGGLEP